MDPPGLARGQFLLSESQYSSKLPFPQISVVIKAAHDPLVLVSALHHKVAALDSNFAAFFHHDMTMDQVLADSLARQRFSIQLMAVFAAIASLLAAIGIYGVLAYLVDQRRRELGIRMALGAQASDVVGLVLRQGSLPVEIGLICGIGGAFGMTRYLKSLLYEISTTDPLVPSLQQHFSRPDIGRAAGDVDPGAPGHSRRPARSATRRIANCLQTGM